MFSTKIIFRTGLQNVKSHCFSCFVWVVFMQHLSTSRICYAKEIALNAPVSVCEGQ